MNRLTVFFLIISSFAQACPKDCEQYQGTCACEERPADQNYVVPAGIISDEKPSRHPEPAYQRGEFQVNMPKSLTAEQEKEDKEKRAAILEGKKAAGIK